MSYYFNALKNSFNYKGRATRSEYWYFVLINILLIPLAIFIDGLVRTDFPGGGSAYPGYYSYVLLFYGFYSCVILIPYISLAVRRLHDIGKSGWMVLIGFIPLLGWIWLLILLAKGSNKFENKYGDYRDKSTILSEAENSKVTKEISPETWVTIFGYILGIAILCSGYFTWIEARGYAGGYSREVSLGGGFMYTIPAGLLALLFTYDKKLQQYRKYYGIALVALSCYLFLSYNTHISVSSGGGESAGGRSKAGLGVILLAITSSLYLLANLIKPVTLGRILTPLFIILSLFIWISSTGPWTSYWLAHTYMPRVPFYMINKYSITLISIISFSALLFRKKLGLSKAGLLLILVLIINTIFNYFQLQSDVSTISINPTNLDFKGSLVEFQKVFNIVNIASLLIGFLLIVHNLVEILSNFVKNEFLIKFHGLFNRHYVRVIWLLFILIVLSLSGSFYEKYEQREAAYYEVGD